MNYYEELGVYPDASAEEIRSEYRKQAFLVHPDHHPDPRLKQRAEARMRLLNEIFSVLGDPDKRSRYDRHTLWNRKPSPKGLSPFQFNRLAPGAWLCGLIAMAAFGAYLVVNPSKATPIAPKRTTVATSPTPQTPLNPPLAAAPRRPAASSRPVAIPDPPPLPSPSSPPHHNPSPNLVSPDPLPRQNSANSPDPNLAVQPLPDRGASWAGNWFYVPATEPTPADNGLYPPIYIELHLQEKSGIISGNYRGIYRVSDKAISGEVRFRVSGGQTPGSINALQWESAGGASGKMELALRTPNLLNVVWWTTQSGDAPSLASGSALLVRQVAR